LLMGWASTMALFAGGLLAIGAASGCVGVAPVAMLSDLQPGKSLSTAIGALRFFGDFGLMTGPAVAGYAIKAFGFAGSFTIVSLPIVAMTLLASKSAETLATAKKVV
jgi:sugar phosphate permease